MTERIYLLFCTACCLSLLTHCATTHGGDDAGGPDASTERDGGTMVVDGGSCPSLVCPYGGACGLTWVDCTGSTPRCRTRPAPAGMTCREAKSECDIAETCDGTSTACPDDAFAPVGTACETGWCGACGTCEFDGCIPGALCETGDQCRVGNVDCSVCAPICVDVGPQPVGTVCDDGDGCTTGDACDADSRCVGTPACP